MTALPTGTVTFLFTDIQGSTKLWQNQPHKMKVALAKHDEIVRHVVESRNGWVFKTVGDAFCVVFDTAMDGLAAALDAQLALKEETWDLPSPILIRAALHTGEAEERDHDYFGPALNRAARLLGIGHGGQVLLSLVATELVRDTLPEGVTLRELGEQRLKDLTRPETVFQVVHPDLSSDFPPLNSLDVHPHNLPMQPTPLIGRERDLAAVEKLITEEGVRIVTLTGPGGMGKTRMGLQVAANLIDRFPHGVWFIDLALISEPHMMTHSIAKVLCIKEAGNRPMIELLAEHLVGKRTLLVLDNFEQILGAAVYVTGILSSCQGVQFLVTSRESLALRGERVYSVPPLELPNGVGRVPNAAKTLSQYESVRLFIERAAAVSQEFHITDENAPAVAEICVHLDGIPLAIELAAARTRLLSPDEILGRLDSRLRLLTSGARDLPDRQRTLRATIEWSYDLLDPPLRSLFRACSAFAGGFTLEAAEAVGAAAETRRADVLDGIDSLVKKSLLTMETESGHEPRLRMLETIREYGLEKLGESPDLEKTRAAHAKYYLDLSCRAEFQGRKQKLWLDRFEIEWDNIRGALEWFDNGRDGERMVRLAIALSPFWETRCRLLDGKEWLANALHAARDLSKAYQASVLLASGNMARQRGDCGQSIQWLQECLALWEEIEDAEGMSRAMANLGRTYYHMDMLAPAKEHHARAIETALLVGNRVLAAESMMCLGIIDWREGRNDKSRERYEECLRTFKELGCLRQEAKAIQNFAGIHYQSGEYGIALTYLRQAMDIQETIGDWDDLRKVYNNLADVYYHLDDFRQASSYYEKLLALASSRGDPIYASVAYSGLAEVSLVLGKNDDARAHARNAIDAAQDVGAAVELGVAHRVFGDIALATGDRREAEQHYQLSIPLLENAVEPAELKKACCGSEYAREMRATDPAGDITISGGAK